MFEKSELCVCYVPKLQLSQQLSLSLNVVSFEQFEPIEDLNFVLYRD